MYVSVAVVMGVVPFGSRWDPDAIRRRRRRTNYASLPPLPFKFSFIIFLLSTAEFSSVDNGVALAVVVSWFTHQPRLLHDSLGDCWQGGWVGGWLGEREKTAAPSLPIISSSSSLSWWCSVPSFVCVFLLWCWRCPVDVMAAPSMRPTSPPPPLLEFLLLLFHTQIHQIKLGCWKIKERRNNNNNSILSRFFLFFEVDFRFVSPWGGGRGRTSFNFVLVLLIFLAQLFQLIFKLEHSPLPCTRSRTWWSRCCVTIDDGAWSIRLLVAHRKRTRRFTLPPPPLLSAADFYYISFLFVCLLSGDTHPHTRHVTTFIRQMEQKQQQFWLRWRCRRYWNQPTLNKLAKATLLLLQAVSFCVLCISHSTGGGEIEKEEFRDWSRNNPRTEDIHHSSVASCACVRPSSVRVCVCSVIGSTDPSTSVLRHQK